MFSFLKKKKHVLTSPVTGTLLPLAKVSDPVFAEGMMGAGVAVEPTASDVYSPVEGTITTIFPTKHAIGIKSTIGKDVLLHIGIDTVELNGQGFHIHVSEGDKVTSTTLLAQVDHDYLKSQGKASTIMVLFPEEKVLPSVQEKPIAAQQEIFTLD
ncbi:PTS sugar transporter subunit IIA [Candidatus Enterococcus willemsii]|uniref:Sugar permease n=1 Tax=Candidatus Enterococcus willemsii TaxID=1857215 RepID=A0ABQ6Z0L7_9ENTE|nr:PTS glucose transporter subunit IIA [Enterococcus sp. CU12B]KAF1304571.1 sugar permease [Enterococcus sp. CU12B]